MRKSILSSTFLSLALLLVTLVPAPSFAQDKTVAERAIAFGQGTPEEIRAFFDINRGNPDELMKAFRYFATWDVLESKLGELSGIVGEALVGSQNEPVTDPLLKEQMTELQYDLISDFREAMKAGKPSYYRTNMAMEMLLMIATRGVGADVQFRALGQLRRWVDPFAGETITVERLVNLFGMGTEGLVKTAWAFDAVSSVTALQAFDGTGFSVDPLVEIAHKVEARLHSTSDLGVVLAADFANVGTKISVPYAVQLVLIEGYLPVEEAKETLVNAVSFDGIPEIQQAGFEAIAGSPLEDVRKALFYLLPDVTDPALFKAMLQGAKRLAPVDRAEVVARVEMIQAAQTSEGMANRTVLTEAFGKIEEKLLKTGNGGNGKTKEFQTALDGKNTKAKSVVEKGIDDGIKKGKDAAKK